ncbi:hypothetical protein MMC07_004513 [Pseudocyphellaria aurata]|nr:hypothetical protein [Pseudocyphellaria aurata]
MPTLAPKPQSAGPQPQSIQYEGDAPGTVEPNSRSPTPIVPIQLNSDDTNSPNSFDHLISPNLGSSSNAVLTNPDPVKLKIFDQPVATLLDHPEPVSLPNTHPNSDHPLEPTPLATPHAFTFGGRLVFPNSASEYVIGSQTIIPGAPAVTISGTPISLPPSASKTVVGSVTAALIDSADPLPPLTIDGTTIFPNSASEYVIGSQTLIPGASGIRISGTPISLAPSASKIVVGSITAALIGNANHLPPLTIDGTTILPNSASEYVVGSQTIIPGAPAVTISGTPISLAPSASKIVVGSITAALIGNANLLPPLTIDGTAILPNSASEYAIGSQTLIPGASGIRISGTPISLAPSASKIVVGSITAALIGNANPLPPLTIDGTTIFPNSASEYVIGSQTLIPGASGIRISGTPISLAPSASYIVIGGVTAALFKSATPLPPLTIDGTKILPNSASEYIIGSQTLTPGGSAIVISGTRISLAPFASALVVDGKTVPLKASQITDAALPLITISNAVITPNAASQYVIAGQTLVPGGPAITVSGTPISLAPSASYIVIGGITTALTNSATPLPPLTIDGTKILPNSASEYIIGSQTLIPGGSAITISGTRISLAPFASALIVDSKTIPLKASQRTDAALPLITIGNAVITPNAASQYVIAGQTLVPGGSAITVSGTRISLAPHASAVIVGTRSEGLGRVTLAGVVATAAASANGPASATAPASVNGPASETGPAEFRNVATRVDGRWWVTAILLMAGPGLWL